MFLQYVKTIEVSVNSHGWLPVDIKTVIVGFKSLNVLFDDRKHSWVSDKTHLNVVRIIFESLHV